ncbi:MAG: glutamate--tRNA ligase [Candidatus Abyssubacteria bacterium]|nr:glutamate--tRNA ligase [Candidatus Abyssubacteria bacterium]
MTQVRVRFAPSPTGRLHIGGARTALINFAFARKQNGVFVLRIEDTDVERSTEASFESIITSLKWLGLEWDEGAGKGGDRGPYRQSECFGLYEAEAEKLLRTGDAYHCYCSPEELEQKRRLVEKEERPTGYDNRCRDLSASRKEKFTREGRSPVVRFRVPHSQTIIVDDLVRGRVSFGPGAISDFIILRADRRPTFHFANVIDDMRMSITHVIRGEDHLPNTPRHMLLFKALGQDPPQFAHLSLILGPDGARLSKRHGATAVEEFKEAGYLPEALVNRLAMLGFAPADGQEVFAPEVFAKNFDLPALGKSAAIFDRAKLDWFNGIYIRAMPPGKLFELCRTYLLDAGYDLSEYSQDSLAEIVDSIRGNMTVLPDCAGEAALYFEPIEKLLEADARQYLETSPLAREVICALGEELKKRDSIAPEDIREIGKALQKTTGAKGKNLYMPVRIAVTGKLHGPELARAIPILGVKKCMCRIEKIQKMI